MQVASLVQKHSPEVFSKNKAEACNLIKNKTVAQVFSCEFYTISKNTFLQNTSGGYLC